jgi:hypothetical protein
MPGGPEREESMSFANRRAATLMAAGSVEPGSPAVIDRFGMNRRLRASVLLAAGVLSACTSMQPGANVPSSLHAGNLIQVQTTSGRQLDLRVIKVDQSAVSGTTPDHAVVQIPLSDVVRIEEEEVDGIRTVGLIVIVVAAAFGIGALLGEALGRGLAH